MTNHKSQITNKILGFLGLILGIAAIAAAVVYPAETAAIAILSVAASGLLIWFFISHFE